MESSSCSAPRELAASGCNSTAHHSRTGRRVQQIKWTPLYCQECRLLGRHAAQCPCKLLAYQVGTSDRPTPLLVLSASAQASSTTLQLPALHPLPPHSDGDMPDSTAGPALTMITQPHPCLATPCWYRKCCLVPGPRSQAAACCCCLTYCSFPPTAKLHQDCISSILAHLRDHPSTDQHKPRIGHQ